MPTNVPSPANDTEVTLQHLYHKNGAPTDGTSGSYAGIAPKGALLIDYSTPDLYINGGTQASPTWKKITRAA